MAEDMRTLTGRNMNVDRRREGIPPGIEALHGGNQVTEQGKKDRVKLGEQSCKARETQETNQ